MSITLRNFISVALLASALAADAADNSVTGVFSTLEFHKRSGDLAGKEIQIIYSFQGHYLVIQCASGVPNVVPLNVEGLKITFTLGEKQEDALCGLGTYEGEVRINELLLWSKGDKKHLEVLPRRESYWVKRDRAV